MIFRLRNMRRGQPRPSARFALRRNHTVTVRGKTMPELFGKFDITLGDVAA